MREEGGGGAVIIQHQNSRNLCFHPFVLASVYKTVYALACLLCHAQATPNGSMYIVYSGTLEWESTQSY